MKAFAINAISKKALISFAALLISFGANGMVANAAPLGGTNTSASFGASQFLMTVPSGTVRRVALNPMADGHTLLSYSQQNSDTRVWQFKTVLIDQAGVAGQPHTIIDNVWTSTDSFDTLPTISESAQGQFFTTWVNETIGEALDTLEVLGKVSTDGTNFSAPFTVASPVMNGCVGQRQDRQGCGFLKLTQAIDGHGFLSAAQVLAVGGLLGDPVITLQAETGSPSKAFSAPAALEIFRDSYTISETGFNSGFGITWGGYLANSNFEFAATTNLKAPKNVWAPKHVLLGNENNVAEGVWQQRDAKTATIVFNSQINSPKIRVADFDLNKSKWAKIAVLSTGGANIVYQSVSSALDAAGNLYCVWPVYNQTNHITKIFYSIQPKAKKGGAVQELYSQEGYVSNIHVSFKGTSPLISYDAEGVGTVTRVFLNGAFGNQLATQTLSSSPSYALFASLPNGDEMAVTLSYDNNQETYSSVVLTLSGPPVAEMPALAVASKTLAKRVKKSKQQLSFTSPKWASYSGVTKQTIQWTRCTTQVQTAQAGLPFGCSEIGGANGKTYLVGKADKGFYISVVAKATNGNGSNQIVAASTTLIK
jgi:hypothetical protein